MEVRFVDIPFCGDAIALRDGEVIWTNRISGDCPPDICMLIVENIYIVDGTFVFELKQEGE